jgi:hypothetical protein
LLGFKYDKLKAEKYKLVVITSFGNLWVVDLIKHLGANGLANMLK